MTIDPIGRRIASYRKARGFKTAAALAEHIPNDGITTSVIQNIESGRKPDVTVAQLLDIAWALRVTPVYLIAPANLPAELFEYPGVGEDVARLEVGDAIAWMTSRMNTNGLMNPTEGFIRNLVHHTDVLRDAIRDFPNAAHAAERVEPVAVVESEDPDTGEKWNYANNPNEANFWAVVRIVAEGERSYEYLSQIPNFDLDWAKRPWLGTKWETEDGPYRG